MPALIDTLWVGGGRREDRFRCPSCRVDREARRTTVRRWLAVMDRRLVPLGPPEDYLLCRVCGRAYAARALAREAAGRPRSEDERAIEALAAAAVFSDSTVRGVEKAAVGQVLRRFTNLTLDPAELDGVIRTARRGRLTLDRLGLLGLILDASGKRRIIQAAYLVTAADQQLHPEESRFLMRIGEQLDMHPRQVREAIRAARGT